VSITLEPIIEDYIDELVRLGLYGATIGEVVKGFVRDGLVRALEYKMIERRTTRDYVGA
jgi:hypothetical protein